MPICHEKKIVLIHIPKSGGTTIEKIIRENTSVGWDFFGRIRDKEKFFSKYGVHLNELTRTNPDRAIYDRKYKENALHHLTLKDFSCAYNIQDLLRQDYVFYSVMRCPFDRLVSMYEYGISNNLMLTEGKTFSEWFYNRPVSCQSKQFMLDDSNSVPDFVNIIDFNHFGEAVLALFDKFDIPQSYPMPHAKKSSRKAIHEYYNSSMIDILRRECQGDLDLMRDLDFDTSL